MYKTKEDFIKLLEDITDLEALNLREALFELDLIPPSYDHSAVYTHLMQLSHNLEYLKKDQGQSIEEIKKAVDDLITDTEP